MPITGLIVTIESIPENEASNTLNSIPGLEVREIGISNLIVTTDTYSVEQDQLITEQIEKLKFVKNVQVIFSNMEDSV